MFAPAKPTSQPQPQPTSSGSGRPLDHATRNHFEARFGRNFGHVRVHRDANASARAFYSLAHTCGTNIVLANDAPALPSEPGRRLLAHELAHVVQQASAAPSPGADASEVPPDLVLPIGRQGDPLEREADRAAEQVEATPPTIPSLTRRSAPLIQRQVRPGAGSNEVSNEERVRAMSRWLVSTHYSSLRVDDVLRWARTAIRRAGASIHGTPIPKEQKDFASAAAVASQAPNLILLHAVIPLLRQWVGERIRPENMQRHFARLNGQTRFVAEMMAKNAGGALDAMTHRLGSVGFDSPLTSGSWDHDYQVLLGAHDFLSMLDGEVAIPPAIDRLNGEVSFWTVGTPVLLAGLGVSAPFAAEEAEILAFAARHHAQRAMTWAMLHPQSAIAAAEFGAGTAYGMVSAGGVEPFVRSLATPEGFVQFMHSLMTMMMSGSPGRPSSGRPSSGRPTPKTAPSVLGALLRGVLASNDAPRPSVDGPLPPRPPSISASAIAPDPLPPLPPRTMPTVASGQTLALMNRLAPARGVRPFGSQVRPVMTPSVRDFNGDDKPPANPSYIPAIRVESTELELGRSRTWQRFYQATFLDRTSPEEHGSIRELIHGSPGFAAGLGYRQQGASIRFPSTQTLNDRLAANQSILRYYTSLGVVAPSEYLEQFGQGRLPISYPGFPSSGFTRGTETAYHDLNAHWVYMALPNDVIVASGRIARMLTAVGQNPTLAQNPQIRAVVDRTANTLASSLDSSTVSLQDDLLGSNDAAPSGVAPNYSPAREARNVENIAARLSALGTVKVGMELKELRTGRDFLNHLRSQVDLSLPELMEVAQLAGRFDDSPADALAGSHEILARVPHAPQPAPSTTLPPAVLPPWIPLPPSSGR